MCYVAFLAVTYSLAAAGVVDVIAGIIVVVLARVDLLLWCGVRYRYSRHDLILIALDYFGPFCQCNHWCSIENSAPHKL